MKKDIHIFIGNSDPLFSADVAARLLDTYTVSTATNGNDIVNGVLELQPDIAILDFTIPEIDVLQWCEKLSDDYPQILTVIYVRLEHIELAKKKWRKRALDYIIGPLGVEEFFEDVNKVVRYLLIERGREQLIRNKIELRYLLNTSIVSLKNSTQEALNTKKWGMVELLLEQLNDLEAGIKDLD